MSYQRLSAQLLPSLIIASAALPSWAFADTKDTKAVELDEFVISANRSEQPIAETLRPVTVITREQIERSGEDDVLELLDKTTGLQIGRNGPLGQTSSVFLRGAGSAQVAVVVDGVRVNRSHSGGFAWEHLPTASIERIEIVRGPHSSLYGADAIGGVIHITTRAATSPYVSLTAGTAGYDYGRARVGGSWGGFYAHASAQYLKGESATNEKLGNKPDDDPHRSNDFAAGYQHSWNQQSVRLHAERSRGDTEYDEGRAPFDNQTVRASYSRPVWSASKFDVIAAHHSVLNNSRGSGFDLDFKSFRNTLEFALNSPLVDASDVTLGVLFERDSAYTYDSLAGNKQFDDDSATTALFAQFNVDFDEAQHEFGFRVERHTAYGDNVTANYAIGIPLNDSLTIKGGFGTAYKTPTLNDLYHPGFEFFGSTFGQGNPDLDPEKSRSGEFGLHFDGVATKASITGYYTHTTDLISTVNLIGGGSRRDNIDDAHSKGVEVEFSHRANKLGINATAAWMAAVDDQGKRLLRQADRTGSLGLDYFVTGDLTLGVEGRFYSDRRDVFFNSNTFTNDETKLVGYSSFNAYTNIKFGDFGVNLRMKTCWMKTTNTFTATTRRAVAA